MDQKMESYVRQIVDGLTGSEKDKKEIADEMKDHLNLLKQEYLEQGFTEREATDKALEGFGEQKQLKSGYQASLFPYYREMNRMAWVFFSLYSSVILFQLLGQRIIIRIRDYIFTDQFDEQIFNRYFFYPSDSHSFFDLEVWQMNTNIIPFQNTFGYLTGWDRYNTDIILHNTLGNVLIFLPLGIFLPHLFKRYQRLLHIMRSGLVISLSIEVLQFVWQVGQFDIDDVLLNTIGAVLGYGILKFCYKISGLAERYQMRDLVE
ncbi:VanZ family protein [Lentibacillus sediminis]|uniref:VanZ family protein n=1 Tax=Lentibacillus sediminis TaxID=1940529 RepID=UPI000C1BFC5C|nr:VanZ family protein [Lentibacillus sediminis]